MAHELKDDPAASAILRFLASGPSTVAKIRKTLGLSKDLVLWELRQLEAAGEVERHKNDWRVGKNTRGVPKDVNGALKLMDSVIDRCTRDGVSISSSFIAHRNWLRQLQVAPSALLDMKMPAELVQ